MKVNSKHIENMIFCISNPRESLCHDKQPLSIKSVINDNSEQQADINKKHARIINGMTPAEYDNTFYSN